MHWIIYCNDKPDSLALREAHLSSTVNRAST
jgi:hypothetical protein